MADETRPIGLAERRAEDRLELLGGEITLFLDHGRGAEVQVITVDMSRSGMAVICGREIREGSVVLVRGDSLGSDMLRATVRWCRGIDEGVYRAGLLFS